MGVTYPENQPEEPIVCVCWRGGHGLGCCVAPASAASLDPTSLRGKMFGKQKKTSVLHCADVVFIHYPLNRLW